MPMAGSAAPSQVVLQTDAAQQVGLYSPSPVSASSCAQFFPSYYPQQMMAQPANYFQSLAQPATSLSGSGVQPGMVALSTAPTPAATAAISMTTTAVPVAAPTAANAAMDDNGPFVLPDPPSDHQQERDQVNRACMHTHLSSYGLCSNPCVGEWKRGGGDRIHVSRD